MIPEYEKLGKVEKQIAARAIRRLLAGQHSYGFFDIRNSGEKRNFAQEIVEELDDIFNYEVPAVQQMANLNLYSSVEAFTAIIEDFHHKRVELEQIKDSVQAAIDRKKANGTDATAGDGKPDNVG